MLDEGDLPEIPVHVLELVGCELLLDFAPSSHILVDVAGVLPRLDQLHCLLVLVEVSHGADQFSCV